MLRRFRRFSLRRRQFLVAAAAMTALLMRGGTAVGPAPAMAAGDAGVAIRVAAAEGGRVPPGMVLRRADYGPFSWLEVPREGLTKLDAMGVAYEEVEGGTLVHVGAYAFDPLVGEPVLDPGLRAQPGAGRGLWLVQLVGPTKDQWLDALGARGLVVIQYHAYNSYVAWGDAPAAAGAAGEAFVRWVGRFQPGYALAPELIGRRGTVDVSILSYEAAFVSVRRGLVEVGASILAQDAPRDRQLYVAARLAGEKLEAIAGIPGVLAVGPGARTPVEMDEASDKITAGLISGGAPNSNPPHFEQEFLTPQGVHGDGVTVHINDAGVDETHNDLDGGRMVAEYGNRANHHGTHVAGIILGDGWNNIGDTSAHGSWYYGLGLAPEAEYVDEYFSCAPATCTRHAEINGANVSNNSWGYASGGNPNYGAGYTANSKTWDGLVQDANSSKTGAQPLIIVAAAGNGGSGSTGRIIEPWEAKNVISVAASRNRRSSNGTYGSGNIDAVAAFSSRGNCRDGRKCPVITAPGQYVISARYSNVGCGAQAAPNSNIHSVCSGTSMASPHVAGAIALLTEWWRDDNSQADPSPALAKAIVVNTAIDMGSANIPNVAEGWGRINIGDAIDPPATTQYWDQETVFHATGNSWSEDVWAADTSKPLKVSLAWTDAPGAGNGGTSAAWVNDIDLRVKIGTTTYKGNHFSSGWSSTGGNADNKNNLENVFIQNPSSGMYTIEVEAANIAGDGVLYNGDATDQDWALVCQNCVLDQATATPTASATGQGTATATPTFDRFVPPTETPTPTPAAGESTATTTPGGPPTSTATASPTSAPSQTPTASATATGTSTNTPPPTATETATATATAPPTATATPTVTEPPTATATPTAPPTPTATATATATATTPPTATATTAPTATATTTATAQPTATASATATSPPATATASATATATASATATATLSPTATASSTSTPTATATSGATATATATATPTPDNIDIIGAAHYLGAGVLKVEAYSSNNQAILDVFDHSRNIYIGTLPTGGGPASFSYPPYPPEIRVQSNFGGVTVGPVESHP